MSVVTDVRRGRTLIAGVAGLTLLAVAGCGGDGEASGESGGDPLTLGMLMAFSGPTVIEGQEAANGCLIAEQLINEAGGVLGSDVVCEEFDTRGTPNESVTAARQMLSSTPDLLSVVGPSTAESVAAVPVLEEAEEVMFSVAGDGRFDRSEYTYYYRLITSDSVGAKAMALHASDQEYDRVAFVFTSGASAQANIPPLEAGAETLGLEVTNSLTIQPEQPSYRTEVAQLVDSAPDAIIYEADAVTTGTFLAELVQSGGEDIPIIANVLATTGDWQEAALSAYGSSQGLADVLEPVIRYNDTTGEGYTLFDETMQASDGENGIDYATFGESVYSRAHYDGAVIAGLAATKADSTDGAVFNEYIPQVLDPGDGKTVVTSYADGVEAIENGDEIQYVGANDEIVLNEYNNVTGTFAVYGWDAEKESVVLEEELDSEALAELNVAD
jgi:branched-chain amino acid transport system substrate-binding protein